MDDKKHTSAKYPAEWVAWAVHQGYTDVTAYADQGEGEEECTLTFAL